MDEIQSLFNKIDRFPYPDTMKMVKGEIEGQAFFPGGKGTFNNENTISNKEIMILGQDFDCETNFNISRTNKKEDTQKNPTWRNLLGFLKELDISPNNCFFTNVILGVRRTEKATGKSLAFKDSTFVENCREFFLYQIKVQRPKAIFVLGKYTAEFLSEMSDDLKCWHSIKNFATIDEKEHQTKRKIVFKNGVISNLVLLTHPSFRTSNVFRRSYDGFKGPEAEIRMVKSILQII